MAADSGAAPPRHHPWLAVAAVLLGSLLTTFDGRLFTVGLPDLRGAFGLGFDEGSWLSTAVTAPQILLAPAVVWLVTVFGLRRAMVGPGVLYAALSAVIPLTRDGQVLLALHLLRGLLEGVFIPATIMIIFRSLPPRWWMAALAIYILRLPLALNLGHALVGFYVDGPGWQWLYWQDVPVALLMGLAAWLGTPPVRVDRAMLARADWGGMLLLGAGAAMIYAGLDQGNRLDWLQSGTVIGLLAGGGVLLLGFLLNEALVAEPWASISVLASRNIVLGILIILAYVIASLSNSSLLPGFLGTVAGLRPEQTGGWLLVHVALPVLLVVPATAWLIRRIDLRLPLILGLVLFAVIGWMGTRVTHDWALQDFAPMAWLQALAQGLTFTTALVFVAASGDSARSIAFAAYIQLLRLGTSEAALSQMSTWLRQREQLHSNLLGLHLRAGDGGVAQALAQLAELFASHGSSAEAALQRGTATLAALVQREATVLSYIDGFAVTFWAAIAGLLLVAFTGPPPAGPLLQRPPRGTAPAEAK
jgi:DHA2 family multidrug resistance protein